MRESVTEDPDHSGSLYWYRKGGMAALSIPGLVLALSFVGFAALAKESGFSLWQTVFMVGVVWALPGKVVLIAAVSGGAALPAVALAVSLSSVRLMPMVVSIIPEIRTPKTRMWVLYALSHFVAVTSWVIAMHNFRDVPRESRTAFYFGTGSVLLVGTMTVTALVFLAAANMPTSVSAAFFLLTPMYFLTSLWSSARESAGHWAMVLGLALGPAFHYFSPKFALLAAGVLGGIIAYAIHFLRKRAGKWV